MQLCLTGRARAAAAAGDLLPVWLDVVLELTDAVRGLQLQCRGTVNFKFQVLRLLVVLKLN
jgi:hypothetical protein